MGVSAPAAWNAHQERALAIVPYALLAVTTAIGAYTEWEDPDKLAVDVALSVRLFTFTGYLSVPVLHGRWRAAGVAAIAILIATSQSGGLPGVRTRRRSGSGS